MHSNKKMVRGEAFQKVLSEGKSDMNILVVDDEPFIRDMLEYILRNFNGRTNRIVTAATGNEAFNEIRSNVFDICFLDVNLPDMSGLRIMDRLRATKNITKIVVMTGSYITDEMHTQIKEGADIFIEKPFDLSRIREVVKDVFIHRENRNLHNSKKCKGGDRNYLS